VVDLAAMRDGIVALGGDPEKINPLNPVDLVIDHSVMIDEFGTPRAFQMNVDREYERNMERYTFLKWGQSAFNNFRVVPPGTGICHQVNLEYLSQTVWTDQDQNGQEVAYPDTLVGTDSHTTMVNGAAVLGWGVGGIEAEAAMLGQPISMLIPEVVGFELTGAMIEGTTGTDLVLKVVEMLRARGVVGKFVEFYGAGLDNLPLADRATIANMAPEYGATCGFFPIDDETIRYLHATGRDEDRVALVDWHTLVVHPPHMETPGSSSCLVSNHQAGVLQSEWVPDSEVHSCRICHIKFWLSVRRHHCRACGHVVCASCSSSQLYLSGLGSTQRVCDTCCELLQHNKTASLVKDMSSHRQVEASLKLELKDKTQQVEWFRHFLVKVSAGTPGVKGTAIPQVRAHSLACAHATAAPHPGVNNEATAATDSHPHVIDPEVRTVINQARCQWQAVCAQLAEHQKETTILESQCEALQRECKECTFAAQTHSKAIQSMNADLQHHIRLQAERDQLLHKTTEMRRELDGLTERKATLEAHRSSSRSGSLLLSPSRLFTGSDCSAERCSQRCSQHCSVQ